MIQFTQIAVAALLTSLAIFTLRAKRRSPVNRAFAAQSLTFAGWVLGVSGLQSAHTVSSSFGFAFAFASLIPTAFVFFSCCYPNAVSWSPPWYARVVFTIGAVFMILSLTSNLVLQSARIESTGLTRKTGALYPAFAFYFIVTWGIGVWVFVKKWRSSRGIGRAHV